MNLDLTAIVDRVAREHYARATRSSVTFDDINATDKHAFRSFVLPIVTATLEAARPGIALDISDAILAARADDLGDGYTAGARIRESDAAIARQVGGVDPLDEFRPRGDA